MQQSTILLIFGGESSEHEVSIISARNVLAALDKTKYNILVAYIDKSGKWWLIRDIPENVNVSGAPQILPILGTGTLMITPGEKTISPDVILPILHGINGEDGTIQGLAGLLHIPIVGCGVEASAIAMDKFTTKRLLEGAGIKTSPYEVFRAGEAMPKFNDLALKVGDEMFIKPANGGSSVGISKVRNEEELGVALSEALKYDPVVLIEKAIRGRELEVGALGNGGDAKISVVGEVVPDREFYDYDSKYDSSSQTRVNVPADLDLGVANEVREAAKLAFQTIGGNGLARIDFFLSDDGNLYLNEINTMPGFTNISMYPKLWCASGMTYGGLIDELIRLALEI